MKVKVVYLYRGLEGSNDAIAHAIVDRLVNEAEVFYMEGSSKYRFLPNLHPKYKRAGRNYAATPTQIKLGHQDMGPGPRQTDQNRAL